MCPITSDFKKLLIFFISKGSTSAEEESQIGEDIYPNVSTHSLKAFITTECFIEYLKLFRNQYPRENTIYLIVDSYSSHLVVKSREKAEELNIDLYLHYYL